MNLSEINKRHAAILKMQDDTKKLVRAFAENIMGEMLEKLPPALGIDPCFVPLYTETRFMPEEDNASLFPLVVVSAKIGTAVRYLLDYQCMPEMAAYHSILTQNSFGDSSERMTKILENPQAMAFCAGMDDHSVRFPSPEKNLRESLRRCPDYPEAYEMGRKAGADVPEKSHWISISVGPKGENIIFGVSLGSHHGISVLSEGRWKYLDDVPPEKNEKVIADMLLEKISARICMRDTPAENARPEMA